MSRAPVEASGRRRLGAGLAVVAVLVGGFAAGRVEPATGPPARPRVGMPAAAAPGALSSTWFCPGATAVGDGGAADGFVAVANPGDTEAAGSVTVHPSEGEARTVPLTVAAHAAAQLRYSELASAPWAAVTVEMGAGQVAVEQVVFGPLGWSASPCASQASDRWYFAGGSTARENSLDITVYNPFPDDAIVDLSFATSEGAASPQALRGVVVRGRSVAVLNVGEHVRRRDDVATTIEARRGRFVAGKIQQRVAAPAGLSWTLGVPVLAHSYTFPEGFVAEGVTERLNLYNPTDREVVVDVEIVLEEGVAEPWELRIPPQDRAVLDLTAEERVPRSVAHALLVRSLDGSGFAAEQWLAATEPSPRRGTADVVGAQAASTDWVFAVGAATAQTDEWVIVDNVSTADATVDIIALAAGQQLAIEGLQGIEVPAGARRSFRLGEHISRPDLAVVVRSSQAIVAGRAMFFVDRPGLSYSVGVPLGLRGR